MSKSEIFDADEPPSLWRRLVRAAREKWVGSDEAEALREAVEELIEDTEGATGSVDAPERQMLTNILSLKDRHVGDCMVPRADVVAIDVDAPLMDLVDLIAEQAHSRIPAYRGTLDEVMGMVHIKDVFTCLARKKASRVKDLLRPVLFVAPSMLASKLLVQMRQTRQHLAMVVDEFGGIDGLISIEDLVEQVVGEIEDEHDDPSTPSIIARPDGTLLVDGRMEIAAFEEYVGPLLEASERETIDTVGGYVFHRAGHVPQIGEIVLGHKGLTFEVLATDQARIKRVRVRPNGVRKG
jgi:CBS domain containing-hemolysin-like protein